MLTTFAPEFGVCALQQLASSEWQIRAQDKLLNAGSPWEGRWRCVRADCNPHLYWWLHPDHGVASLIRESTSGQVYK